MNDAMTINRLQLKHLIQLEYISVGRGSCIL